MNRARISRGADLVVKRGFLTVLCAASLTVFVMAGTTGAEASQGARAGHVPASAIGFGYGARSSGRPAAGADTPAKPAGCFHGDSQCVSSDHDVSFGLISDGDTTGCTFGVTVDWGNGGGQQKEPTITGGPDGTKYGPYKHDYKNPGTFQIEWTATLESNTGLNNCESNSDTLTFTLITAGIYADFQRPDLVEQAVDAGWTMIANVAGTGQGAHCQSPWTAPANHDSDSNVEEVLATEQADGKNPPAWISYWTPEIPQVGTSLSAAGQAAGEQAATDIESAASGEASPVGPAYVVLDFEESMPASGVKSCGKDVKDTTKKPKKGDKQCWQWQGPESKRNCFQLNLEDWLAFARGWVKGIEAATYPVPLSPAVYVTQGQYKGVGLSKFGYPKFGIGKWDIPVIIAVDPVTVGAPVTGDGIVGYAAFGDRKTPATCATAPDDIKNVEKWGGISTIQFGHRGDAKKDQPPYVNSDYCTPSGHSFG